MDATTKDLRLHARELLSATDRGETVFISWRGRRRAVLTRWQEDSESASSPAHNPAYGLWRDHEETVDSQIRRLRQPRQQP